MPTDSSPENSQTQPYAALIGVDWSQQSHAVVLEDLQSGSIEERTLSSDPAAIDAWVHELHQRYQGQKLALCVELSRGALIYQLASVEFIDIYPLNPVTSCRFRKAFYPSGAKSDLPDARIHLSILRAHRDELTLWRPLAAVDQRLLLLCEKRRALVQMQVDLRNRLISVLREYFPQAEDLAGEDLASPMACAFLRKWPDLPSLKRARKQTIRQFYYAQGCRRGDVIERRLAAVEQALPLTEEASILEPLGRYAQSLVDQLVVLNKSIKQFNQDLEEAFQAHPDQALWKSFPGAGPVLAPRLAAAWTTDRERFAQVEDMQTYSGTAPVRSASGKKKAVFRRYHRPRFLHQSFWEYAKHSANYCPWAKHYVEDQVKRGKKRSTAYRSLAFKWQRIMFACWQTRTPYDEARYAASLQRSGSPHLSTGTAA